VKLETIFSQFTWCEIIGLMTASSGSVGPSRKLPFGFSIRLEMFVASSFVLSFIPFVFFSFFYLFLLPSSFCLGRVAGDGPLLRRVWVR